MSSPRADRARSFVEGQPGKILVKIHLPFEAGSGFTTLSQAVTDSVKDLKDHLFHKIAVTKGDIIGDQALYVIKVCKSGKLLYVEDETLDNIANGSDKVEMSLVSTATEERRLRVLRDGMRTAVYAWGDNDSGQLALSGSSPRGVPAPIPELHNVGVIAIAAGGYTTAAITAAGDMYMWGRGVEGHPMQEVPTLLTTLNKRVTAVACGSFHMMLTTDDGALYSWGNGECGQLGHGPSIRQQTGPWKVHALRNECIVSIACGNMHSAVASAGGSVYTWGSNEVGQLGSGSGGNLQELLPQKVQLGGDTADSTVLSVACGFEHTVCVTAGGNAYSWGGNSYGQLGQGNCKDCATPLRVALPSLADVGLLAQSGRASVAPHRRAKNVACGVNHTAIVTEEGECWLCGCTGRLVAGGAPEVAAPVPLEVAGVSRIAQAAAGNSCTVVLAESSGAPGGCTKEDDCLFTLGTPSLDLPQGNPQEQQPLQPRRVALDGVRRVVAVTAGFTHMLVIVELPSDAE